MGKREERLLHWAFETRKITAWDYDTEQEYDYPLSRLRVDRAQYTEDDWTNLEHLLVYARWHAEGEDTKFSPIVRGADYKPAPVYDHLDTEVYYIEVADPLDGHETCEHLILYDENTGRTDLIVVNYSAPENYHLTASALLDIDR